MINKLDKFHKSMAGLLLFGLIELAVAYGLVSLAIDRGNILYYLLALILFVGFLQNITHLIGKLLHGRSARR